MDTYSSSYPSIKRKIAIIEIDKLDFKELSKYGKSIELG